MGTTKGQLKRLYVCPDCGAKAWLVKGASADTDSTDIEYFTARCRLCDALWRIETLDHMAATLAAKEDESSPDEGT